METPGTKREGTARRRSPFLIGGLVVLLLVLAGLTWAVLNVSAIAERVKEKALADATEQLGRKVEAGPVHVRLLPFGLSLADLSVAGGNGEPPLLKVGQTTVSVRVWPLIRSRGKDVEITAIELRDPDINLVRRANGTWSHEDLARGKRSPPGSAAPKGKPREIAISRLHVVNGSVKVIDRSDQEAPTSVALSQLSLKARDIEPGRPLTVEMSAALASDAPNLSGSLTLDPLPANADELRQEHWPKATGELSLDSLSLRQLEGLLPAGMARVLSTGSVTTNLKIETPSTGTYALKGDAQLQDLAIRGAPAKGSLKLSASFAPGSPAKTLAGTIDELKLQGQGVDLTGKASFSASPRRIQFNLEGPQLDLDTVLALRTKPPPPGTPLVPPSMRSEVEQASVTGTIRVKEVHSGRLRGHDLDAQASLDRGVLTLTRASVGLYSGRATLDGTTIDLTEDKPVWNLRANLNAIDLRSALSEFMGSSPLTGLLAGELAVTGAGNDWAELRQQLSGSGRISLASGELTTADLGAQIAQPLAASLRAVGLGGAASKVEGSGQTRLEDLSATFAVKDGALSFGEPIKMRTPFGGLALGGKLGLDQSLALTGQARLSQSFLASFGAGSLVPANGSLDIPLNIGGTLQKPAITGIDWTSVAKAALSGALQQEGKERGKSIFDEALRGLLRGS